MQERNVIVVGAAAGGLEALRILVTQLPAELPAPVFVVTHLARDHASPLASLLSGATSLAVTEAVDGEPIRPGHIYVARPDHHLLVDREQVRVTRGPTENGLRPSIDVLFRSAALSHGGHVIGIVLSGALDDGVSGAFAVKERGGVTMVQDPIDALYAGLPLNVIQALKLDFVLGEVDYVLPVAEMGAVLKRLSDEILNDDETVANEALNDETSTGDDLNEEGADTLPSMQIEVGIARGNYALENGVLELGMPSYFTCPDCHGMLLQFQEGQRTRFRCHTGHAFSSAALLAEITKHAEEDLWNAVRSLEEGQMLLDHLKNHLQQAGETEAAGLYDHQSRKIRQRIGLVRQVAMNSETLGPETLSEAEIQHDLPPENPTSENLT